MVPRFIFLVGLMGSGKSTLGRAVAFEVDGCRYFDLDAEVEFHAGGTVADIFAKGGEDAFRRYELETLEKLIAIGADIYLGQQEPPHTVIIGTGGGTPTIAGAMELMNRTGQTVLLEASEERLLERLCLEADKRPLIAGKTRAGILEVIRRQKLERAPYYELSTSRFCSEYLDNELQITRTTLEFIDRYRIQKP